MSPINKKNDTALALRSVTKSYDGQPVLSDLSLEFSSGTFYCLMAPSGNGKTTMFRLILGLEKPDSGVILFGTSAGDTGNNDIKASSGTVSKSDPCRIRGMRPLISAVFQENRLLEGYTAIENLRFALGKRYSSEALTAYLLRLLPGDALNKPVCEFSWLLTSQPYHPICQSLTTIYEKECASRDRLRQSTSSRECASF